MTGPGPVDDASPRPRYAELSRSLLRETILRAVDGLVRTRPWSEVTMAQVAAASGVSRQTVYNELGGRADLAVAYASWAGDQLLDEVERCVAAHRDDLQAALVAAFTVFLDQGAGHPLIRAISAGGGDDDLAILLAAPRSQPVITGATHRLGEIIATTWPDLPAELVPVASEVLVRLAVSHLLHPTSTPDAAARQLATLFGPFLAHLEAGTSPSP